MSWLVDWWGDRWPPLWLNRVDPLDCEIAEKHPHLLLIEMKQGLWREQPARGRAKMAAKVMRSLGMRPRDFSGPEALEWLKNMEPK